MAYQSIARQLRGIDSAVQLGIRRALNKAVKSTKSKVVKDLRNDTGLKTDIVARRVMSLNSKPDKLKVSVNIATKIGVPFRHFQPKVKKVTKVPSGGLRKRAYLGVTARVGGTRELVPGAFFMGRNSEFVIARKLSYSGGRYTDSTAPRRPTVQLRTTIFLESAKARQVEASKHLQERFDKTVDHEINFAISKRFST